MRFEAGKFPQIPDSTTTTTSSSDSSHAPISDSSTVFPMPPPSHETLISAIGWNLVDLASFTLRLFSMITSSSYRLAMDINNSTAQFADRREFVFIPYLLTWMLPHIVIPFAFYNRNHYGCYNAVIATRFNRWRFAARSFVSSRSC